MKFSLVTSMVLACLSAPAAPAIDVFNVPSFTENESSETVTKKVLSRDTVVQMDPFSLALPKGWSFLAAGHSEKMTASITATPTTNIEKDETYFGLNERRSPSLMSLEDRAQKYKKEKKNWKVRLEEWNNVRWLVAQYKESDSEIKKEMSHWAAFATANGKEYWMLAGTPTEKEKEMDGVFLGIMKSTAIRGVAIAGSSEAVAAKTLVPSIDPRLQARWKVVGYKLDEVPVLWTDEEAKALVGKTIVIDPNHIAIGGTSCDGLARPIEDKDEERTLLRDVINPCSDISPGGPIFSLVRKSCSKKTGFPPYMTFESQDGIVAFGDAVSFCLHREKDGKE